MLAILLLAALFLGIQLWDKQRSDTDTDNKPVVNTSVVEYNGENYVPKKDIETFLVIGIDRKDTADEVDKTVQADFLMLFVLDKNTEKTTAIHINRDTMTNVNRLDIAGNTIGTEMKQIALAYNYAYSDEGSVNCRNTADAVSGLLRGVKVNHYLSLTMEAVPVLNDLVGGVQVTVLDDFTGIDDTLVKGKDVVLRGEQALLYVQARGSLENTTNLERMKRQRQYVEALSKAATARLESDSEFALHVADKLGAYVEYDSTEYRLQEFAKRFDRYDFLGVRTIEGTAATGKEYIEFYPDTEALQQLVMELFYDKQATAGN